MLTFNTTAITSAALRLERFRASMQTTAANRIREQVVDYAALSKAPDGSQWSPLTPAYKKRKAKMGQPPIANKRVTGKYLASVVNRNGVVAPSAELTPQGMGLEKKRVSFDVAPNTVTIIEAALLKSFNAGS